MMLGRGSADATPSAAAVQKLQQALRQALALHEDGDLRGAEAMLQKLLARASKAGLEPLVLAELSLLHVDLGQLEVAEREASRALELLRASGHVDQSQEARALVAMGWVRQQRGDLVMASRHFDRAFNVVPASPATLRIDVQVYRGLLLLEQGEGPSAAAFLRAGYERLPSSATPDEKLRVEVALARVAIVRGNLDLARRLLPAATPPPRLKAFQAWLEVMVVQSQLLAASQKPREAVKLADTALREARSQRSVRLALEAELARETARLQDPKPEQKAEARAALGRLAAKARQLGFESQARRAAPR
jgi:tetratricopeptide (TPR) repeat protein